MTTRKQHLKHVMEDGAGPAALMEQLRQRELMMQRRLRRLDAPRVQS